MSARSRLTRREIHGVLRALRNLDRKKRLDGQVEATAGEILGEGRGEGIRARLGHRRHKGADRSGLAGGIGAAHPRGEPDAGVPVLPTGQLG